MAGAASIIVTVARNQAALVDPMLVVFVDGGFVEVYSKVVSLRSWAMTMGRVWL